MQIIKRLLNIKLPKRQSSFLWGPRKTGKSTLLHQLFPQSIVFDLLKTDLFFALNKNPSLLREQILALDNKLLKHPVIIDEIQKVPQLLDEVHWLIENKGLSFILCGSSARKLKRGHANLLGGRAWRYELFPFVSKEIGIPNLLKILNNGMIPSHYFQDKKDAFKSLKSYVQDYLKEEVFAEGLTRNIPAFSRFFDSVAFSHGELVNYSNIARDCGVDSKTVKEYYQILVDTLLGRFVEPFKLKPGRNIISQSPKFYLFDVGVAGIIKNRNIIEERGDEFGRAFEHFILMEIAAYSSYSESNFNINFWRTKTGVEVDFVLGNGEVAIEIKGTNRVDNVELRSIKSFTEQYHPKKSIVVCNEKTKRLKDRILIMPWRTFLQDLWDGSIIK